MVCDCVLKKLEYYSLIRLSSIGVLDFSGVVVKWWLMMWNLVKKLVKVLWLIIVINDSLIVEFIE